MYVTWWERNSTSNEPVMRISNDNGKTFAEIIKVSGNSTASLPKYQEDLFIVAGGSPCL